MSAPRQFRTVDDWRLVIEGQPHDAAVGQVHVGDIRMLLHRIDELEAANATRPPTSADPRPSYGGLRQCVPLCVNPAGAT